MHHLISGLDRYRCINTFVNPSSCIIVLIIFLPKIVQFVKRSKVLFYHWFLIHTLYRFTLHILHKHIVKETLNYMIYYFSKTPIKVYSDSIGSPYIDCVDEPLNDVMAYTDTWSWKGFWEAKFHCGSTFWWISEPH